MGLIPVNTEDTKEIESDLDSHDTPWRFVCIASGIMYLIMLARACTLEL